MFSDRTVLGVTIAVVLIACATFFIPDWVRQIGLLSMAIGSVALGLLVLWRTGLISFGHALFYGFSAYGVALLNHLGVRDAFCWSLFLPLPPDYLPGGLDSSCGAIGQFSLRF